MWFALIMLALSGAQPADPSAVEDPFAVTTEAPAPETASTAPTPEEAAPSRERLTCRSRPILGSRISRQRVCKTEEEWRLYENDLEQSRRDIADRGARGCDLELSEEC